MKILLFGKNGQVGLELQRSLANLGDVIALERNSIDLCGDLTNLKGIGTTIKSVRPNIIVNAAAYTAVDKAESDRDLATLINVEAPAVIAQEAANLGACLIHYSTDYVFNGSGQTPWVESDGTDPVNFYGKTKCEGEKAIQAVGGLHLIFRTSWVYAAHGNNFVRTILRLAKERDTMKIVNDQIGAPTAAAFVADMTAHVIKTKPPQDDAGIYHLTASGETSWYDFACHIVGEAHKAGFDLKLTPDAIIPIPSHDYPTPAARPKNSRLNTDKFSATFQVALPDWHQDLQIVLKKIAQPSSL